MSDDANRFSDLGPGSAPLALHLERMRESDVSDVPPAEIPDSPPTPEPRPFSETESFAEIDGDEAKGN